MRTTKRKEKKRIEWLTIGRRGAGIGTKKKQSFPYTLSLIDKADRYFQLALPLQAQEATREEDHREAHAGAEVA